MYLHDALGEVREKEIGLVSFTLAVLYRLVIKQRVQLHSLVRRRAVLVLHVHPLFSAGRITLSVESSWQYSDF